MPPLCGWSSDTIVKKYRNMVSIYGIAASHVVAYDATNQQKNMHRHE